MADTPLSPESILQHMADALPTHAKDDTNSDLSSSYEAIALFAHACMTAVGFRLVGYREGEKTEAECTRLAPRLSAKWNSSFGSHSFLYAHSQSSMQYLIKVDRLGGKAEIRGIGLGDERISRFEVTAKDYVSSSALPLRITLNDSGEDRSDLPSKLKEIFISPSRVKDLASLFQITIIQKLIPGLHKEGYEEARNAGEDTNAMRESSQRAPPREQIPPQIPPHPFHPGNNLPNYGEPRLPPPGDFPPPGFDDEYDMNRLPRAFGPRFAYPGDRPRFDIGHDDLNPPGLGPHDPLRGSFVGGGVGSGPGGFGGMGGGGMHPTFDDPLFGGQGGVARQDPRAPPGARYDPIGPGDGPQRGGGGRPPNPFGGFGDGDFV